jgi:hypothetical protein
LLLDIILSVISIILLVIAFKSKALMDLSGADKFKGEDYNKNRSYTSDNKWLLPYTPGIRSIWYLWLYKPKYREAFPYSSTALVFLTDYWHKMQFYFLNTTFIGNVLVYICIDNLLKYTELVGLYKDGVKLVICFILIRIVYLLSFNPVYDKKR